MHIRGAGAALNIILITDEDRDDTTGGTINFDSVLSELMAKGVLLNVAVNATFIDDTATGALGIDSASNAYTADGSGGFNTSTGGLVSSAIGTTEEDYVDLALATGGAAWNLNQLRLGGTTATSFTSAFINVKVQEIVPEPSSRILIGAALLGAGLLRRKRETRPL